MGTSSILAAACVKALYEFFGEKSDIQKCCDKVLDVEQVMSTGGGWQDQLGALCPGIKITTTKKGVKQIYDVKKTVVSDNTVAELEDRLCLIYTGQRRLARNLLRDIIGKYICSEPDVLFALKKIQNIAILMNYALEQGNIDEFAQLLNEHWEMSKMIDAECTNTCIDMIFESISDLICGKMVCGAGGGGFLQVILKKGITKDTLSQRLNIVFADAGPKVWDYCFDMG